MSNIQPTEPKPTDYEARLAALEMRLIDLEERHKQLSAMLLAHIKWSTTRQILEDDEASKPKPDVITLDRDE